MKLKKFLALLLMASMMTSAAGCSKQFDETMVSVADKACKSVIADNYKKVESCLDGKNKNLESAMDLESDDDAINDAIEIILGTMTYEVDEDSLVSDFFGREGSVDVRFSVVDYESVLKDKDVFRDMDEFEEAIEECDDTIDTSITLEFEKADGDIVITNGDEFADLFGFKDIEFSLTGVLLDHILSTDFAGAEYDSGSNTYTDTNSLQVIVELDDIGTEYEWAYSYTVDWNSSNVYSSGDLTKREGGDEIVLDYFIDFDGFLDDGSYTFILYDGNGEAIASSSCTVTHNEPEPEPEPEPVNNGTLIELPYYVDPDSNPAVLPGGDYQIAVPTGFSILPTSDPLVQQTASNDLGQSTCIYMTDPTNLEIACVYLNNGYLEYFRNNLPEIVDIFTQSMPANCTIEETYSEQRTIADQTVDFYIVKVTHGFYTTYYAMFFMDCGDHGYFIDMSAGSIESFDEYIGCITHV